uniref:StbD protein n=1 Tax=Pseudomonas syringae TaxID=317 RepID=Q52564_PSESX|nr:stbD [Pseudomonas syringae]
MRAARETVRENEVSCYIQTLSLVWFCAQTRFTWLTLTPASRAVSAMLHPPLLRAMTRSCILVSGLRPAYRPAPLAKSMPWRCRSRRSSKSSRAICKATRNSMSCTPCNTTLATPRDASVNCDRSTIPGTARRAPLALIASTSFSASTRGRRLIRSIFSAMTTSPGCRSSIMRNSSGRSDRAPEAFSR